MGQQISMLQKQQSGPITYHVKSIEQDFTIRYDKDMQVPVQTIDMTVVNEIDPALKSLPNQTLMVLQHLHQAQMLLYIFPKLKTFDLCILYLALNHLIHSTPQQIQAILKRHHVIEILTSQLHRDIDVQALVLAILYQIFSSIDTIEVTPQFLLWLVQHFNPYNVTNVVLIIDIFSQINCNEKVIQAFQTLRQQAKLRFYLEPLFKVLEVQHNIFAISQTVKFISDLLYDKKNDLGQNLKDELIDQGLCVVLEELSHKLQTNEFVIQNCSLNKALEILQNEKLRPKFANIDLFYLLNLDDFDPSAPLKLPLARYQEMYSEDALQFETAKGVLKDSLESCNKILQEESDDIPSRENYIIDRQNMATSIHGNYDQSNIFQSFRPSMGRSNEANKDLNLNEIYADIKKANKIEDIIKKLQGINDGVQGVSQISRLLDLIGKTLTNIHQKEKAKHELQKSRIQNQQESIAQLQNEINALYNNQKNINQEANQMIIQDLKNRIKQIQDENLTLNLKVRKLESYEPVTVNQDQNAKLLLLEREQKYQILDEQFNNLRREYETLRIRNNQLQTDIFALQGQLQKSSQSSAQQLTQNTAPKQVPTNVPNINPIPPPITDQNTQKTNPPPPPPPGVKPPGPPPPPGKPGPPPPPGSKLPPPLPGGKPAAPQKPKCKPSVPLRQLAWNMIKQEQVPISVWNGVDETTLKIDIAKIEEKFANKPKDQILSSQSVNKTKGPTKITLLAPERVKNIELILGKLKMSNSLIVKSIIECNMKVLTLAVIESLLNVSPTEAEFGLYNQDDLDRENLQVPDQFLLEISVIPSYNDRLATLRASFVVLDQCTDLKVKFIKFLDGFDSIRNSENLKLLLKYGLAYGNYLNGESQRGGAYGFKLDAMIKAADLKTNDQKQTLLMLIVEDLEKTVGRTLVTEKELEDYEFLSKLPLSQMNIDINELKKISKQIKNAIKSQTDNPMDMIELKHSELDAKLNTQIDDLVLLNQQAEKKYEDVCLYYLENPKQMQSDVFFTLIFQVWSAYMKARNQLLKNKQQEQKEEERAKLDSLKRRSTIDMKSQQAPLIQVPNRQSALVFKG